MAYLAVFIPGHAEAKRYELGARTVLGRSADADICIDQSSISRRHCRIERTGQRWMLLDLGSTNGTWLDAARVRRYALRDGETFYIGDARIVFHADRRVAHRPADPHEALSVAKIFDGVQSLSDTALAESVTRDRTRPLPRPSATVVRGRSQRKAPIRSLAFQRPPAMPIVKDHRAAGGWVHVMLKSIRG